MVASIFFAVTCLIGMIKPILKQVYLSCMAQPQTVFESSTDAGSSNLFNTLWTVLGGVTVFVFGQIFQRLLENFRKPTMEYKELRAEVAFCLIYYADKIHNPLQHSERNPISVEQWNEAARELRKMAAKIESYIIRTPQKRKTYPLQNSCLKQSGASLVYQTLFLLT